MEYVTMSTTNGLFKVFKVFPMHLVIERESSYTAEAGILVCGSNFKIVSHSFINNWNLS